jgi:hypothetical protein
MVDGHSQLMEVLWIKDLFFYRCYVYALTIVDYILYMISCKRMIWELKTKIKKHYGQALRLYVIDTKKGDRPSY